ncbi:hypothetical protein [Acidovorax sp. BLS4]|uniref:hypothetical protein n=1 Tax=Acidovorax sp. BLS4 TaxID=3273430 RepID=UPI0029437801|nr:hypothetical protein [Paracidovorax avenae]WOI43764.1 hypothetical protein R1Z03_14585 [Paracidovorax avenae]
MALVMCKECGSKVANSAKACPGCGSKKFGRKHTRLQWAFLGGVTVLIFYALLSSQSQQDERAAAAAALESSKTPEQRAAESAAKAKAEADFAFSVNAARGVKATLKNPASFELVSAVLIPSGALCLEFRGTNSFNAVVTQNAVVGKDGKPGNWNRDCGGKSGKDMKSIRHAM